MNLRELKRALREQQKEKFTQEEREDYICDEYRKREKNLRDIADETGLSPEGVRLILIKNGIELNDPYVRLKVEWYKWW